MRETGRERTVHETSDREVSFAPGVWVQGRDFHLERALMIREKGRLQPDFPAGCFGQFLPVAERPWRWHWPPLGGLFGRALTSGS